MVRPAISSVIRCIASRRSTGALLAALSLATVSSVAASMCGTSVDHRARRERRRQRSALVLPRAPFGNQQALAEDRTQHADADRRACIVFVIVDQHVPDRIRRVEDETVAPEEAALDDIFLIGTLAPAPDRADADRLHPPEHRHVVGRPRRAWRHQRRARGRHVVGFGYAHGCHFRSPDERSDIRDPAKAPHIASLMRATAQNYVFRSGRHKAHPSIQNS